eukprot:gb/GEZN01004649.1/.p1 GENE.gb/GEZN01004649.1/~~gb/GEZN01004649.1/.p1  ORF type:complete len:604 (+),score=79.31 gb/GEZN01004649.1/:64-1875(+)
MWYALVVLWCVYALSFCDRTILSILAEEIKADLDLTDAQLGFLYGTAFSIFYAVFGLSLARLADLCNRKHVIASGCLVWSVLTCVTASSSNFMQMTLYRVGVGVGEAAAGPAAYSLLADAFPLSRRGFALSAYASAIFVGVGLGILVGGLCLSAWSSGSPDLSATSHQGSAPFGLKAWQAAYLGVGLPGLLFVFLVLLIKEPQRGQSESSLDSEDPSFRAHPVTSSFSSRSSGVQTDLPVAVNSDPAPLLSVSNREGGGETETVTPGAWVTLLDELFTTLPPFHLWALYKLSAPPGVFLRNFLWAILILLSCGGFYYWLGDLEQWIGIGCCLFAAVCWVQVLALRDPPVYRVLFHSTCFLVLVFAQGLGGFVGYGISFWNTPLLIRKFDVSERHISSIMGPVSCFGGLAGAVLGGVIGDRLQSRFFASHLIADILSQVLSLVNVVGFLLAPSFHLSMILLSSSLLISWSVGLAPTILYKLLTPEVRGAGIGIFVLCTNVMGLALGPYVVGKLSDSLVSSGRAPAAALQLAMLITLTISVLKIILQLAIIPLYQVEVETKVLRAEDGVSRIGGTSRALIRSVLSVGGSVGGSRYEGLVEEAIGL